MRIVWVKFVNLLSALLDSLTSLTKASRADKLLIAAFVVATLRQMGVNGHFIGYDPASIWDWFEPLEVFSGIAMAVLEGIALAYVSRRWRRLDPATYTDWTYWSILMFGQLIMLISIIVAVALYAYAAQRHLPVSEVFSPAINMTWNIMVAGVNPLIALLIGIVDDDSSIIISNQENALSEEEEAWLILIQLLQDPKVKAILPPELAEVAGVSEIVASKVIVKSAQLGMLKN